MYNAFDGVKNNEKRSNGLLEHALQHINFTVLQILPEEFDVLIMF